MSSWKDAEPSLSEFGASHHHCQTARTSNPRTTVPGATAESGIEVHRLRDANDGAANESHRGQRPVLPEPLPTKISRDAFSLALLAGARGCRPSKRLTTVDRGIASIG